MLTFFRKNYKASGVIVRILFVLAYIAARWQTGLAAALLVSYEWWLGILSLAIVGVCLMLLLPVIVNVILNLARIYSVPRAEFVFLAYCFFTVGLAILALLNLVNLFTPLALVWGGRIFPFAATLVAFALFYGVTGKNYFNDVTRPHYFKTTAICFVAFVLISEVL